MNRDICIRVSEQEWAHVGRLAGRDGQSRTGWCRLLVRAAIARQVQSLPRLRGAPPAADDVIKDRLRMAEARAWGRAHPECCRVVGASASGIRWMDAAGDVHLTPWEKPA